MTTARRRWNMLAEVIVSRRAKNERDHCIHSVRRFTSFGLFRIRPVDETFVNVPLSCHNDTASSDTVITCGAPVGDGSITDSTDRLIHSAIDDANNWFEYSLPSLLEQPLYIRHVPQNLSPKILQGFNNTGNVCMWVSEEVMAYFCLINKDTFKDKSVCELGGGMTCLAGLCIAKSVNTKDMLLTDGNEDAVANVRRIVNANKNHSDLNQVSTRCLRWPPADDVSHLNGHFDIIISADCLFFDVARTDLVDLIHTLLKPQGEVIIFAPSRGTTLDTFVQLASRSFTVQVSRSYDEHVSRLHSVEKENGLGIYNEDLHYPLLIRMTKIG